MSSTFIRVLTILTGLVIAGEALALVVGMHLLSPAGNPWISLKNDLLLVLDIVAGLGLIIIAATAKDTDVPGILYVLLLVSAVAHGYREWEYLARVGNAFCANAPLFVVNNAKLVGLLVVVLGVIWAAIASKR
ncbi:MAG: hypothetical protein JXA89_03590 [Anaerolineae bacterium]|nr:hypothetical protein [Anaerolineae bacterium]